MWERERERKQCHYFAEPLLYLAKNTIGNVAISRNLRIGQRLFMCKSLVYNIRVSQNLGASVLRNIVVTFWWYMYVDKLFHAVKIPWMKKKNTTVFANLLSKLWCTALCPQEYSWQSVYGNFPLRTRKWKSSSRELASRSHSPLIFQGFNQN